MTRMTKQWCGAFCLCLALIFSRAGFAWGNRGHRMVNLVAAETLPEDMPGFMRTPDAIHEISYFGPEPDRWRPVTEPELNASTALEHKFELELGDLVRPYPRHRYDFIRKLASVRTPGGKALTPEQVGLLPWQVIEVFDRLKSAFMEYRVLTGEIPRTAIPDLQPLTPSELPYVEQSALFYAGWLGHYIGDGSQPLHTTVNFNGWVTKPNPKGYTEKAGIHTLLEQMTDNAIQSGEVRQDAVRKYMAAPRKLNDPFGDTISYLRQSHNYAEEVYQLDKQGALKGSGTPESRQFVERRIAFGGSMLRDMIYTAWLDSNDLDAPPYPTK